MAPRAFLLLLLTVAGAGATVVDDLHPGNYVEETAYKQALIRFVGGGPPNTALDKVWAKLSQVYSTHKWLVLGTVHCDAHGKGKEICEYMGISATTITWGNPWQLSPYYGEPTVKDLQALIKKHILLCSYFAQEYCSKDQLQRIRELYAEDESVLDEMIREQAEKDAFEIQQAEAWLAGQFQILKTDVERLTQKTHRKKAAIRDGIRLAREAIEAKTAPKKKRRFWNRGGSDGEI